MAATDDIVHLLRRTEYVARPERVSALMPGTYAAAVDDVLNVPAGGVPIPAGLEYHDDSNSYNQYTQAVQWWFERMAQDVDRGRSRRRWRSSGMGTSAASGARCSTPGR